MVTSTVNDGGTRRQKLGDQQARSRTRQAGNGSPDLRSRWF
jgi:hypothetical protein